MNGGGGGGVNHLPLLFCKSGYFETTLNLESLPVGHVVKNGVQGFETNGISWNTKIQCDSNNDSFIFNRAQFQSLLQHVWARLLIISLLIKICSESPYIN